MEDLIFGLISSPDKIGANNHAGVLRELTLTWLRYGYQGSVIEASNIDDLLQKVSETSYSFCLIQTEGHVIDEKWHPAYWNTEGFYDGIWRLIREKDFFIIGEIENNNSGYPGLKTDCLLVNMNYFRLAKPKLGNPQLSVRELNPFKLAPGHTIYPAPKGGKVKLVPQINGWNFINTSLGFGLPVQGFSSSVNTSRFNLKADTHQNNFTSFLRKYDSTAISEKGLTESQFKFLNKIKIQLDNSRNSVFLWNIESYDDLTPNSEHPIGTLFSVASGFKPVRIIESNGCGAKTKVVYFDYSKKALEIRKLLVEEWDGKDFPHFVKHIMKLFPYPSTHYQLWEGITPENINWRDVELVWEQELNKWGGAKAFQDSWLEYRALPHEYMHCNLLADKKELLARISSLDDTYIWWSNAFFTVYSNWLFSYDERRQLFEKWIESLAIANPTCLVNGSDHNNSSVNGLTASEYFNSLRVSPANELVINKLHQYSIRY
ncbi:MAG: hypothetical protein ABIN97_12340 [Ginsengibacter sp.]